MTDAELNVLEEMAHLGAFRLHTGEVFKLIAEVRRLRAAERVAEALAVARPLLREWYPENAKSQQQVADLDAALEAWRKARG